MKRDRADTEGSAADAPGYNGGMSEQDKHPLRERLEESLRELQSMGNEIRGKLGEAAESAKGEATDAWKKLEPRLQNAEKQLKEAADSTVESLGSMFEDLKSSLRSLRDKM